jgi:hypothetical protein
MEKGSDTAGHVAWPGPDAQAGAPRTFNAQHSTSNIQHPTLGYATRQVGAFTYFGPENNFVKSCATGFDVGIILIHRASR